MVIGKPPLGPGLAPDKAGGSSVSICTQGRQIEELRRVAAEFCSLQRNQ